MDRPGPEATALHKDCHELKQGHFLNDQIDEWRVLQAAQPIFSSAKLNWTIRPERGYANSDNAGEIDSENAFDFFNVALQSLPKMAPIQALSCVLIDDCLHTLADVLRLLDSLVDDCVLNADIEDTLPEKEENSKAEGTQGQSIGWWHLDAIKYVMSWLGLPSTESVPPSTISSSDCTPTCDNTTKYPKLQALAKIFESKLQSGIESGPVFHFCSKYLLLEQATKVYEEVSHKLHLFLTVWDDEIRPLNTSNSRDLFPLSIRATNWEDPKPAEFARQLFNALNERVSRCLNLETRQKIKHTVLLQLNGFQFEGESVSFDAFFSCKRHSHWKQSRFSLRNLKQFSFKERYFSNLCNYVYDPERQESPPTIISISVAQSESGENLLLDTQEKNRAHDSDPPTVSFAGHLSKQSSRQLAKPDSVGLEDIDSFGAEDKADLALSLARSLLHLFESPWADWPWTADSIQFLYHRVSDKILDNRRPYVLGILQDDTAKDEEPEIKCERALISLVRLLLSIEMSSVITIDAESPHTQLYNVLQGTNISKELPKYHLAIEACLKFSPALARSKKYEPKLEPNRRIRRVMYITIIRPLEENLSQYQYARTQRGRNPRAQAGSTGSLPAHVEPAGARIPTTHQSPSNMTSTPNRGSPVILPRGMAKHGCNRKRVKFADELAAEEMDWYATESSQLPGPSHHIPSNTGFDQVQALFSKLHLVKKPVAVKAASGAVLRLETTVESPTPFIGPALLGFQSTINDSDSWLSGFDLINHWLKAIAKEGTRTVRVSVLDTGCNLEDKFFNGPGRQDDRLKGHWFDCLDESDEPVDEDPDSHGTAMVALLLRLLPNADIYVFRVARDAKGLSTAKESIANAICHAVKPEWDTDIISISFGFPNEVPSIRNAILAAEKAKDGKILFFAASNNVGLNMPEMFPAFFESVISVRGTRFDGSFHPKYDPAPWAHKEGTNYGTLGENVPCGWTRGCLVKSGCSVATPIMVAIAATVIWIVACEENTFSKGARAIVQTRRGILSVFDVMTENQKGSKRYLAPWQLFGYDVEQVMVKMSSIGHALEKLPPQELREKPQQGK